MRFKGFDKGKAVLDVGLDTYVDKGDTVTLTIDNLNILDWYPLDKMAEYRYDINSRSIWLRQNGGTNHENWPDLPELHITRGEMTKGVIKPVKKYNEAIAAKAYELFSLPSPSILSSRDQADDAISKALRLLSDLEEQIYLLSFYEDNELDKEEHKKEIDKQINLVGTMYRWYTLMRKAF